MKIPRVVNILEMNLRIKSPSQSVSALVPRPVVGQADLPS